MLRRMLFVSLASLLAVPAATARPKLGDTEWLRRFGVFVNELNQFLFALNQDRLDRARWDRVRFAWAELERGDSCATQ